ncbi:heterocyst formation ABC transporter subunit HepA [Stenomitos frigidus]|uniref:ABC transporter ATP-binding protein n=1 Tax=Stenomitos frigidus ULC18 TaxID=2107698 RepID=A0A2T1DWC8_9CYAN|nr:heterocyst formation ABC transporter subunit HepA [Stenomitos frigidus]PSB24813.1 ABC transporter ATP-binding protein [Stenomitos frigidus ULC18]
MLLRLPAPLRRSFKRTLKATSFWQENYTILREFKHFPLVAILAIGCAMGAASFEGFSFGFLLAFLQSLVNPDAPPFHTGLGWFDQWILGVSESSTNRLYRVSALILAATWIRSGFNYLTQVYTELTQQKLVDRLRKQIFEQLQALSLGYFSKTNSGELLNTLTSEIGRLQAAFGLLSFIITRSLTLTVYVYLMFRLSWQLSIVSLTLFILLSVALSGLMTRIRQASTGVSSSNGRFTATAMEFINGIRTVQAFATQDFERRRFYKASSDVLDASMKATKGYALVRPLAEALATTVLIGMIILALTLFVTNGIMQTATLLTFLFILFRLVPALHEINGSRAAMGGFWGSLNNIRELLETENKPYLKDGHLPFSELRQAVTFKSVDFGYDSEQFVLNNINLTIKQGEMTALVGASGAGKTTLVDLIPRFYDPTRGGIFIDGVDLREFQINSLRRRFAIVSQDTFIFNTTVHDNIAYGTEGATEDDIIEVAKLANALEFIQEMPEGFDTRLGDRGVRLSGGQRQRIAIARAILRNPDILILDEATSALDSISERLIQASLEKLAEGRTVIAIAHRLSTIIRADKVVVMEQGRVVEEGSYQELLDQRGKLWNYHQMQYEVGDRGNVGAIAEATITGATNTEQF